MRIAIGLCMKDLHHRRLYVAFLWLVVVFSAVVDVLLPRRAQLFDLHPYIWVLFAILCFLITTFAVQSDPLMGDRRFWITRPISWGNLLTGKILFIICTINAPVLIAQSAAMLANGIFPLHHLSAIARTQLSLAAILAIAAVFASVTRNLVQVGLMLLAAGFMVTMHSRYYYFNDWGGARNLLFWIDDFPLILIGALLLWLQYRIRKARLMMVATFILIIAGISQYDKVGVNLWHTAVRYRARQDGVLRSQSPVGMTFLSGSLATDANGKIIEDDYVFQVRFTGIPEKHKLILEGKNLIVTAPDGSVWESGWGPYYGSFIISPSGDCRITASIDRRFYQRIRNQEVMVHALMAFSLIGPPAPVIQQQGGLSPVANRAGLCGIPWEQIKQPMCIFTDFPSDIYYYSYNDNEEAITMPFNESEFSASIWRYRTAGMGGFSKPPERISVRREVAWFETTMDIPRIRLGDEAPVRELKGSAPPNSRTD